jgi:hypothetical protein
MFARQLAAHFDADFIDVAVGDGAVGPREINVFKNAEGAALCSGKAWMLRGPFLVDDDDFARLDVAHKFGVDQVKRAGFAGQHPGVATLPRQSGRKPKGSRTPINSCSVMMTRE